MTNLKSIAEQERERRIAWGRVKQALIEYLLTGKELGTPQSRQEEYRWVQDFIRRVDEAKP